MASPSHHAYWAASVGSNKGVTTLVLRKSDNAVKFLMMHDVWDPQVDI